MSWKPEGVPVRPTSLARELLELVDLLVEDRLDRAHLGHAAVVADLEEGGLGPLDQLARLAAVGEDVVLDLARGREHAAQQRVVLDDAGVVEDGARRAGTTVGSEWT